MRQGRMLSETFLKVRNGSHSVGRVWLEVQERTADLVVARQTFEKKVSPPESPWVTFANDRVTFSPRPFEK